MMERTRGASLCWRRVLAAVLTLLSVSAVHADEAPPPATVAESAGEVQKAISAAQAARADTNAHLQYVPAPRWAPSAEDIATLSKAPGPTPGSVSLLNSAITTLSGSGMKGLPDKLKTDKAALEARKTALKDARDALEAALKQADPPPDPMPKPGVKEADVELKDLDTAISAVTAATGSGEASLSAQRLRVYQYAAAAAQALQRMVATASGAASIPDPGDNAADALISPGDLARRLTALADAAGYEQQLVAAAEQLDPLKEGSDEEASLDKMTTALRNQPAAESGRSDVADAIRADIANAGAWAKTSAAGLAADQTRLQDAVSTILAGKTLPQQDEPLLKSKRDAVDALEALHTTWYATQPRLADLRLGNDDDAAIRAALETAGLNMVSLANAAVLTRTAIALLDETLVGDWDNLVQDQVRLFYTPDVRGVMEAINPATRVVHPERDAEAGLAKEARETLRTADADVAAKSAVVNDLTTRLRQIDEDIRQVKARAAAAKTHASTAATILAGLNFQNTQLVNQKSALDTKLGAETDEAAKAALQAEIDKVQQASDNLGTRITEQTDAKKDADAAAAAAREDADRLNDEQATLPARRDQARKDLSAAQTDLARQRRLAAGLAQDESDAFAAARDNVSYLEAPARGPSKYRAYRVQMLGYPASRTIFLRGKAEDVEYVKELIAGFDRPVPQSRISLWSLQMSGSNDRGLNEALSTVDTTLRDLRGNLTLVQDLLRNAVNEEVNRVAHVAEMATDPQIIHESDDKARYTGRMARYFYYQREVRRTLGFGFTLPDGPEELVTVADELDLARNYLDRAAEVMDDVPHYKLKADRDRAGRKAVQLYRRAGYHFLQAQEAFARFKHLGLMNVDVSCCNPAPDPADKRPDAAFRNLLSCFEDHLAALKVTENTVENQILAGDVSTSTAMSGAALTGAMKELSGLAQNARLLARAVYQGGDTPDGAPTDWKGQVPTPAEYTDAEYVTRFTLPDPAHGTTLGEILFILSLGERRSRERILSTFLLDLAAVFPFDALGDSRTGRNGTRSVQEETLRMFAQALQDEYGMPSTGATALADAPPTPYPYFPRTVFGGTRNRVLEEFPNQALTANQREILVAIQARVRDSVAAEIRSTVRQINNLPNKTTLDSATAQTLRQQYLPLVGWLYNNFYSPGRRAAAGPVTWYTAGIAATGVNGAAPRTISATELDNTAFTSQTAMDGVAWNIARLIGQQNTLSRATPRVAAADDMIKRMIIVTEDDLEHFFVQPALENLQRQVPASGVRLGVLQRESVLASNRLVARVDPRGTADAVLNADTDVVDSAQQLAQLGLKYAQENADRKLTSTGPLAAGGLAKLNGTKPWSAVGIGAVASLLGDLATQPRPPGEIYSIGTGNRFQITPVFDPSGQALRFRFDYVGTVNITEPDGTTNRQLPRVERHTVNTEVQLTNLELREISRFSATASVGTPSERSGGLPLFNQAPLFKELPIVGYYVKRKKKDAVRQESIIFAQTSMYPTVSDIVDLLVDVPPRSDLSPLPPASLYQTRDAGPAPEPGWNAPLRETAAQQQPSGERYGSGDKAQ